MKDFKVRPTSNQKTSRNDISLRPFLKQKKNQRWDSVDLLNKYDRNATENAIIANFDAAALCKKRPHVFGKEVVSYFLQPRGKYIQLKFNMPVVVERIGFKWKSYISFRNSKVLLQALFLYQSSLTQPWSTKKLNFITLLKQTPILPSNSTSWKTGQASRKYVK